jgi:hypothetical protein
MSGGYVRINAGDVQEIVALGPNFERLYRGALRRIAEGAAQAGAAKAPGALGAAIKGWIKQTSATVGFASVPPEAPSQEFGFARHFAPAILRYVEKPRLAAGYFLNPGVEGYFDSTRADRELEDMVDKL